MKTAEFKYCDFHFDEFNSVQNLTVPIANVNCNLVVAAPTSSGKTEVGEIMASTSLSRNEKVIWLSPLRALSSEKYQKYVNEHYFKRYKIEIMTGDFTLDANKLRRISEANLIIMTSEMLDSRTRRMHKENNEWLMQVTTLVVDEIHLISVKDRGSKLEAALMRFSALNKECRIVALSATIPKAGRLKRWLETLNNKKTALLHSTYRPVELQVFTQAVPDSFRNNMKFAFYNVSNVIKKSEADSCHLVFCHTRKEVRECTAFLNSVGINAEFHTAEVNKETRARVEQQFRNRQLKAIVATTTLAWGINMPARYVHILGVRRGLDYVHIYDLEQMKGRAGRFGIDPVGMVYYYFPQKDYLDHCAYINELVDISSEMNKNCVLFHLCAEIERRAIKSKQDINEWWSRTFEYSITNKNIDVNYVVDRLLACKAITVEEDEIKIDKIGRISAWLYFDPFDVYSWLLNLNTTKNKIDGNKSLYNSEELISWAILNSGCFEGYETNELKVEWRSIEHKLKRMRINYFIKGIFTKVYVLSKFMNEVQLSSAENFILNSIRGNIDRVKSAMVLLNNFFGLDLEKWLNDSFIRIKYGIKAELISLCKIKNIGKTRARKLYNNEIEE